MLPALDGIRTKSVPSCGAASAATLDAAAAVCHVRGDIYVELAKAAAEALGAQLLRSAAPFKQLQKEDES